MHLMGQARHPRARSAAMVVGALALAVTTMIVPDGGTPAGADEAAGLGPVNGGFEDPVVDGVIPGWTQIYGSDGAGSFTVVDSPVFGGDSALRVVDPDDDVAYGLLSQPMPVQPEHSYELSLQVYPEAGEPPLPADTLHGKAYLYFYDEDGARLDAVSTHFRDTAHDEWNTIAMNATAPEGAASVEVLLYTQAAEASTYVADDVTFAHTLPPVDSTDLGVAMQTPNVRLGTTDVLPDGTPVAYLFSNGFPVSLSAVDLRTGDVLDTHQLEEGHTVISSAVVADDHTLYFSARSPSLGAVWAYDPITQDLERVLEPPMGETAVNDMLVDGDVLYGSTYPGAKVWSYDTGTGELRDFGSLTDAGDYARAMTMVDGKLWIGTSTSPQLIELDPESGESTERALPPDMEGAADFFTDLVTHGDLVIARYSPAGAANAAVYDMSTGTWSPLGAATGWWTDESVDGEFFYADGQTVLAYDVQAREPHSIGWEDSALAEQYAGTSRMAVVELGTADFPGPTLVGTRADGSVWRYNLETRTGDVLDSEIAGSPARIHSVGHGNDGEVYFGAYLSAGVMARIDTESGALEQISGPSQASTIVAHRNRTVVSQYPNAVFHAGDATREWVWDDNPEHLFTIGRENGQDRALNMVSAGPVVAAGTIPNYGELGGALVLFNPFRGGEYEMHRHVVQDQSITSLAYRDGRIYGGTSIHGAINSEPTQSEAELFVWDRRRDRLVTSDVVVEGAEIIHSLAFDSEGRLWGMADDGTLFEYDPDTDEVVRRVDTGLRNANVWGRTSELFQHPVDGLMYGNAGSRLFRFDPETLDFTVLPFTGVRVSAVNERGTVYFADNTNVYRLEM